MRDFGEIEKDRSKEIQLWTEIFKDIQRNEMNIKMPIAAITHYANFGPITVQLIAKLMG